MKFRLGSAVFLLFCLLQPEAGAAQGDIFEVAQSLGCDIFVQFMNTSLSIPDSIVDVDGTYTLFAIRDEDLSASMIRLLGSMTPARRGRYMSYFIGNGTYFLSDFENDKLIDSATIWPYTVRQLRMNVYNNNGDTVYTVNGRGFVTNSTDQDASNGVVHLIDGFLLYDTYSSGGLIERYPYYSELQDALAKVNLFDILTGEGPFTVFAPLNTAFEELFNGTRILDYDYPLKGILQGHIVEGTYFSDGLFDGDNLTTLGFGRTIRISVNSFDRITLNDGQASVINERYVNNGVIYTINGVLTVESDLNENTIMDVAQDLGCDIMLDYLFESRIYDKLRDNATDGVTLFALEDVGFTDIVRHRLDALYWEALQHFMIYHVADGQYTTNTMGNDQIIQTYEEDSRNMRLNIYGDEYNRIFTVNGRSLTRSNRVASNGVVHTVDSFVYSASWSSCGRYIEGSPELLELEEALDRVGLLDPLFGDEPCTIFAPQNGWYTNLNVSDDMLKEILQGHILDSTYYTEGLLNNAELTTVNNKIITVTVDPSTDDITLTGDSSATTLGERTVENGVLHLIDELIFTETGIESTTTVTVPTTTTDDMGTKSTTTATTTTVDTGTGSTTTVTTTTTESSGNGSTTTDPTANKSPHYVQFNALFLTLVTVMITIKIF